MIEFAGFELPIWYKGIVPECKAVRNSVGIFDVSHMGRALISGEDAVGFLDCVTTNNVAALDTGRGHY
jgi:aminomethyltransferase